MKKFDVLIVGAGVVGLTTAVAMAEQGFSVALFDKQFPSKNKLPPKDLRVYAINQQSKELLQTLNIWSRLGTERLAPYQKMHIWDAANNQALDFDAQLVAAKNLGTLIEESVLKHALALQIAELKTIQCFEETSITTVNEQNTTVTIGNGQTTWEGNLLIIADGRHSPLRQQLKVDVYTKDYQQEALIAIVQTEKPHEKTAYQVFLPRGPLAFLPLVDPHECSIVWSTSHEVASALKTLPELTFNEKLSQAYNHTLGTATLCSERRSFPLVLSHARQYVGNHWLLMGDAAHTIHPLAGLGLNLGLADLHSLLTLLEAEKAPLFSPRLLQAYQRQRKYSVSRVIAVINAIHNLFSQSSTPLTMLRGFGLAGVNYLSPLKRLLIEQARGHL